MSDDGRGPDPIDWLIEAGIIPAGQAAPDTSAWPTVAKGSTRGIAYVAGALRGEARRLAAMSPDSGRNDALNNAAWTLGRYAGAGWIDKRQVWDTLLDAGVTSGMPRDEVLRTLHSGMPAGLADPRDPKLPPSSPSTVYDPAPIPGWSPPIPPRPRGAMTDTPEKPGEAQGGAESPGGGSERRYRVTNPVVGMRWLLDEIGTRGLSGMLKRNHQAVYTARLNEEGYVTPACKDDDNGPATIHPVTPDVLTARLALNYFIHKVSIIEVDDGEGGTVKRQVQTEIFFPTPSVRNALAAIEEAINLRLLRGVTHTPMVRKDGSILTEPGYDVATGFLFLPTVAVPEIPEHPDRDQIIAAVRLLRGMVDQFQWAGDHDEANFLGVLLTPLLRELTPPPYKLSAIMARQPGSGKSLLAEIVRGVHGGVFRSEMPHDDAELAKSLTSILTCTTAPVVQFDNVGGTVRSSRLAGLLTSGTYSDRVLGSTNSVDMANDRVWMLTGNNMNFGGDLVRRTLWVTIDPGVPNPQARTGFRLHMPTYVAEHRGEIIRALLVLVRAWSDAGASKEKRGSDSYADWSATVRAILSHTRTICGEPEHRIENVDGQPPRRRYVSGGIPGEFDHDSSAQQTIGIDDEGWGEFLIALYRIFPGTEFAVREVIDAMGGVVEGRTTAQEIVESLPPELHEKYVRARETPSAISKSLGRWFLNRIGRWAGELVVERGVRDPETKVQKWRIRKLTTSDSK